MKRLLLFILLFGLKTAFGQGAPAGNALNFDGANDYVQFNERPVDMNTGSFTIETWIKTTSVSAGIYNYSDGNTSWDEGEKCFYIDADGTLSFVGWGKDYILSNKAINDGRWHHIAVTYNYATNVSDMYVDGVSSKSGGSFSIGNRPDIGTGNIGKPNYAGGEALNYFQGSLDQFRIWNVARSASEISANYKLSRLGNTSGLVASYNFNEGIANAANPTAIKLNNGYSTTLKGTLVNFALTGNTSNWVAANANNALDFTKNIENPAQSNYVRSNAITAFNFGTGDFTIETRMKTVYTGGGNIVALGNVNSGNYWLGVDGGTLSAKFSINGVDLVGTSAINDNKWHHVAATRTAGITRIFVDGTLESSGAYPANLDPNNGIFIGDFYGDGGYSFPGQLDDVKIYSRALSAAEIQNEQFGNAIVSTANLVSTYNFNQGIAGGNNPGETTLYDQSANANDAVLNNFTLTGATSNWVSNDNLTPTGVTASAPNNSSFTATWAAPNTNIPITGYRIDVATDAAFANIIPQYNDYNITGTSIGLVDLKPGTTYYYRVRAYNNVYETSANSASASATTTVLTPPGNAINFDKNDDYVSIGTATSLDARTMKTVEAWVKFKDFTGTQEVISKSVGSKGLELLVYANNLCVYAMGGGADNNIYYPVSNLQVNKWYHIAFTHNGAGTAMKLYVNGVSVGTTANTSPAMVDSGSPLTLGTWAADNNRNFSGTLDEVKIWSVERTAAEILANMNLVIPANTPGLSAYYNFDHGIANGNNYATVHLYDQTNNEIDGFFLNATLNTTLSNWVGSYAMVVPTATPAGVTNSSFTANWTAPAYGTVGTYTLDYATNAAFTSGLTSISGIPVGTLSQAITNLKPGTTYYYRVYAVNGSEIGANSNVINATTLTLSPPGNALHFDGVDDYVAIGNRLSANTSYTKEAWVYSTTNNGARNIISSNNNPFWIENGVLSAGNGGNFNQVTSPSFPVNRWVHVAVTYDAATSAMTLYVDGNMVDAKPASAYTAENIFIGSHFSTSSFFEGRIDNVRIWNVVRTAAQILSGRTADLSAGTGLVASYNFDLGTPGQDNTGITTLFDQSANAFNGTLNGFALNGTTSNWVDTYAMTVPVATPATSITGSSFVANWTAPTVGTADKYFIDVATDTQFTNLVITNADAGNALSYTASGLDPISVYYYRVRAYSTALATQGGSSFYTKVTTIKADQIITMAATANVTYGDADFNVGASSTNTGMPAITYATSDGTVATVDAAGLVHILKAGTVTITASQVADLSYNAATPKTQAITIAGAALTVEATGPAKAFGQALTAGTSTTNFTAGATQNGEVVSSVTLTPDAAGASATTPAGSAYTVTPSAATGANGFLAGNYNITYLPYNGTVGVTAQTITFNPLANATYGAAPIALTATSTSGLPVSYSSSNPAVASVAGNTLTVHTAGTVTITASQAGDGNFTPATSVDQSFTVDPKAITVTADIQTKVYGTADPALTYTNTPLVGADAFSGALSRLAGENIGTYAIGQNTLALSSNYTLSYVGANLAITAKPVTVTATAGQTKVYGTADPVFAYTINTPLIGTDGFTGALTRAAGENIGAAYAITQGNLALSSNYTITYTGANFSITAKPITAIADAKTKEYGSADPALTFTTDVPLIGTDSFTGNISRTAGENAGTYAINKNTLALSSNYTLSYTTANLSITKKGLTITADNKVKFQGTANPALTASYAGFIAGENNTNLITQPALSTTATNASVAGTYPIVVNAATSNNYAITFVPGTLTVTSGIPTSLSMAQATLYENRAAGTTAGSLSSTSLDPGATFTYTLVTGTGSTDNGAFSISGNQLLTAQSFDFETKNAYNIRVRTTTQYGLSLEQAFTVNVSDVNEVPTLSAVADQAICYVTGTQSVALAGITAGPETAQSTTISVSSNNPNLFATLNVSKTGTAGTLSYSAKTGASGTATVTVTVQDNGGTANNGTDTFTRTFTITVFALPTPSITSNKGNSVGKGETIQLTATGGTSYVWAANNGIVSGQNTAVLTVRPSVTTTYTVTATNANGCSESASFTIAVESDYSKLVSTNILTPNNDGFNDKWVITNIDLYGNNEAKVFDKAGRLVYSKKNYDNSWDGTFNGAPLSEDTYYYIVDFGPGKGRLKGFITIIREQ